MPKKSAGYQAEKGKGGGNKQASSPSKSSSGYVSKKSYGWNQVKPNSRSVKKAESGKAGGPPSLEDYLGSDPYYQQALSELMLNMDQFGIQNDAAEGDINSLFDLTMKRLQKERDRSLVDITDDFGARGLVNSGLYGKGISDYNDAYSDRVFDLNRDRDIQLRNLGFEENNFQGLNQSKQNELRLDAIRRRAEELGSRVGSGFGAAGVGGGGNKKKKSNPSSPKPKQVSNSYSGYTQNKNYGWNQYKAPVAVTPRPSIKTKSSSIKSPVRPGFGKYTR